MRKLKLKLLIVEGAPPRPPPPSDMAPPRPPPPDTDDEEEFPIPQANQPIMVRLTSDSALCLLLSSLLHCSVRSESTDGKSILLTYLCPSLPVKHRPSTAPCHRTLFWAALVVPDQLIPCCFSVSPLTVARPASLSLSLWVPGQGKSIYRGVICVIFVGIRGQYNQSLI